MQVTEENFDKVAEILGYIGEFMLEIHSTTGYKTINLRDRIEMAQLGVDALERYFGELRAVASSDSQE